MARLSSANLPSAGSDPTSINLTRMLARLQQMLVTPDSETETRLRVSNSERARVGTNLEYARSLLLKLEQEAQSVKVQSRKHDTQAELVRKRETLQRLSERLQELNELGEYESHRDEDSSEGEDLLGEDTPSEETESLASPPDAISEGNSPEEAPTLSAVETASMPPITQPPSRDREATLRARHKAKRAELLTPSATSTGISTATAERILTDNRMEHENLTSSLLDLATRMKSQSMSFATSLEEEKSILDAAAKGLDKSELGMEAAQKRMGTLRKMSEGTGWYGRILLYAWIAGLMVIAILVVFVMPKLRFSPGF